MSYISRVLELTSEWSVSDALHFVTLFVLAS
jgi:hypothetical protein